MSRRDIEHRSISLGPPRPAEPCVGRRNNGWYWEVNRLLDNRTRVVPFFRRFPLVGTKAGDFECFASAVELLSRPQLSESDYTQVLFLREQMNRGGKRRYTMERILRDYTPSLPVDLPAG